MQTITKTYKYKLRPTALPICKNQTVGIDVGVAYFAVTSKGQYIHNPRFLDQYAKRIRVLQRKLARQDKGSKASAKTKLLLSKTYLKLRRCREDHLHKLSTQIVRENSLITVEKLNLKGMTRSAAGDAENPGRNVAAKSGLNRLLLDLAAGMFYGMLEYKSGWQGRDFVRVNPAGTSQTCSDCGYRAPENRVTQAAFICQRCGKVEHADFNAAKNIDFAGRALRDSGQLAAYRKEQKEKSKTARAIAAGRKRRA